MKKKKPTAGERMIASAKRALAFAKGEKNHGCVVHIPQDIDVTAIRKKVAMSQSEFANMFGFSKKTWSIGNTAAAYRQARLAPF